MNNTENYDQIFNNLDKEILKKMEDPNYEVTYHLPPNSSEIEKMKYQLCQDILKFKNLHNLKTEEIAKRLNINGLKVKEILHFHIYKFNLEELINYAEKLANSVQERLIIQNSNIFVPYSDGYQLGINSKSNCIL